MNRHQRESEAAATLHDCRQALAARDTSIVDEMIGAGVAETVAWRHYPEGEVYDPATHAQYFYHCHPGSAATSRDERAERGHFHLFLRGEGMPAGTTPVVLPEFAVANAPMARQSAPLKRGDRDEVCHLVAIAVDGRGQPIRLFTTNRWVTGETWYRADDVIRMLDRFYVRGEHPSPLVNRWLGAVVRLFEPDIAALLRARDRAILDRRWRWRTNVLEDPRLEIASSVEIDLDARLAAVAQGAVGAVQTTGRARQLPRMAEGWGA